MFLAFLKGEHLDICSNIKNIYICPINASIDCKNNMADYVHPTQEGYEEIGTMLYGFIRGIN